MDYDMEMCRRSCILELHAAGAKRTEFFRHAGAYSFVKFEYDRLFSGPRVLGTWSVPDHFDSVIGRFDRIVERFYNELTNPRSAAVATNLSAALAMAGACCETARPWMLSCSATPRIAVDVAEHAFDAAKWHFGPIATSSERMTSTQYAASSAAMLIEMGKVHCKAEQQLPRIFA